MIGDFAHLSSKGFATPMRWSDEAQAMQAMNSRERFCGLPTAVTWRAPNVGAGASGIGEHREETQRPLHETMRLAEAWLMRHAPGGSMPSQTLKHCKIQSRKDAPKMAILEAPCAQNAPCRSTMRLPESIATPKPHLGVHPLLGSHNVTWRAFRIYIYTYIYILFFFFCSGRGKGESEAAGRGGRFY